MMKKISIERFFIETIKRIKVKYNDGLVISRVAIVSDAENPVIRSTCILLRLFIQVKLFMLTQAILNDLDKLEN